MKKYSDELIDKTLNYKSVSDKEKIDRLLEIDAIQYTNLGTDSTKSEKLQVRRNSKYIYKAIQKINNEMGSKFLYFIDK
jgi:hypothetical protein